MQLPSNKIAKLFIIVVIIVSLIIAFSIAYKKRDGNNVKKQITDLQTGVSVKRSTEANNIDTDLDNLFDWQENIWNSDPNNKDTDGDGTTDGDEIEQGRSPIIKGPDDNLEDIKKSENDVKIYDDYVEGTLTDEISKNLFGNYLNLKQLGTYDTESQAKIVSSIAQSVETATKSTNYFSRKDMKTVASSPENLKIYGDAFAQIQTKYALKLQDISNLEDNLYVESFASIYDNMANDLSGILIPTTLVDIHIEVLNNLKTIAKSVLEINQAAIDPVRGLFAVKNYNDATQSQQQLYISIAEYFKSNGILFSNETPSNLWNTLLE